MEPIDTTPQAVSNLSRFHETSAKLQRYKVLFRRRWWFLLLFAAIAVCIQTLRVTGKETEYLAVGKIVAGPRINLNETRNDVIQQATLPADFYGTQIEILTGGELRRRALDRVRSLHPEIKEIDVEIKVTQTRGSSILNVAGIGKEPKYTRLFLDALLDEYMAFRREMIERSVDSAQNKVIEEVLAREKKVKDTKANLENFLKNNNTVIFEGERNESAAYLSKLKAQLNDYETERKLMEKMGLDDYLRQKDRETGTGPAQASANTQGLPNADGAGAGSTSRSSDLTGGLSRPETEYLRALSDLKLLEAERLQQLRIYKPEHPNILDVDDKIEKQKSLIEIHRQSSADEWQRRLDSIRLKIANLNDEIKVWENRAREANDKIVMHQSLRTEATDTNEDYQDWKKTLDRLNTQRNTSGDMVAIMERPMQANPDEPALWIPLGIALVVGLVLGTVILLLFDRLDDRMNSFSEFQSLFPNETVLGQIPEQTSRGDVTLIKPNDDRHLYAEAFRNLRSSIMFKQWRSGHPPKMILVTSAVPNEGKTTTVANMAITMALSGARVLLADADLRRGGMNEMFGTPVSPGFSEVLTSRVHWRDAVQETSTRGLHVLSRGEALDQTSELFLTPFADEVLEEIKQEYDYVIFDSAPVLVADDTASFAPKVEAVLFVIRMSSTMARLSAKALEQLYDRQVNVAGVILNRSSTSLKEYTYYNYASYYTISHSQKAKANPA